MSYQKILVAYDGSDHAKRAVSSALELIEFGLAKNAIVLYVTGLYRAVDPMLEPSSDHAIKGVMAANEFEHEGFDEEIAPQIIGFENVVEIMVRVGNPKDEILRAADAYHCGLIIMGSRGLGAIRGALGSVSFGVIRDSEVPVFIVK